MAKNQTPEENIEERIEDEVADMTVEEAKTIDPKARAKAEPETSEEEAVEQNREETLVADKAKKTKKAATTTAKKPVKAGAKARRAKAETEEAETVEGEERKGPRQKANPPRPRSERSGKRYREAYKAIDHDKTYSVAEAVKLLPETSKVKFDASVELHVNLGVDPKQADQAVRGTISLPHGTGKTQRVAALVPEAEQKAAKDAGADTVGLDDLLDEIGKGNLDFDILVAHPDVMSRLGRHAKVLGPKGLMPSPKSGTVTTDVATAVAELKKGRVEFRVDRYGIIHQAVGKASFEPEQLTENIRALMQAIQAAKPASTKGIYMKKVTVTTTMGPAIKLDVSTALDNA